jgi:hypothetical protein
MISIAGENRTYSWLHKKKCISTFIEIQSLDELNASLWELCLKEAARQYVPYTKETVSEMWEKEKVHLHPLPANRFEACKLVSQINKTFLITIDILSPIAM